MQGDFLVGTLAILRDSAIHTALETAGLFGGRLIDDLAKVVDLFLFDIKHADDGKHREFVGVTNETILGNFREILSRAGPPRVIARVPLIPGFNTDAPSIERIVALLADTGYRRPVHLMPYNRMAKSKWEKIGRGTEYRDMGVISDAEIERIEGTFRKASFEVVVNR